MAKPLVAFVMGDPAGIGPEVAVAALRDPAVRRACRPLAVGARAALERAGWRPSLAPLLEVPFRGSLSARRPTAQGGRASFAALEAAMERALAGEVRALVTAPACKESWALAGVPHRDHTDYLRARMRRPDATMMLLAGDLRAVLVTRHLPLARVSAALSAPAILRAAALADGALRGAGFARPRLGLCGLNPHAGERGLIGTEERRVLAPAARAARRRGLRLEGPLPADAAWAAHGRGRYDALVALYHDQALIPMKLAAGYGIVNWTIGVPLTRTAPGHGTAFDIAWRRRADPSGMVAAALWAARAAQKA